MELTYVSAQTRHSASMPVARSQLSVDKVWGRESGELARCVRNVLQAFRRSGYSLLEVVDLAVLDTMTAMVRGMLGKQLTYSELKEVA